MNLYQLLHPYNEGILIACIMSAWAALRALDLQRDSESLNRLVAFPPSICEHVYAEPRLAPLELSFDEAIAWSERYGDAMHWAVRFHAQPLTREQLDEVCSRADQGRWTDRDLLLDEPARLLLGIKHNSDEPTFLPRRPMKARVAAIRRWPSVALYTELSELTDKQYTFVMKDKVLSANMELMVKMTQEHGEQYAVKSPRPAPL